MPAYTREYAYPPSGGYAYVRPNAGGRYRGIGIRVAGNRGRPVEGLISIGYDLLDGIEVSWIPAGWHRGIVDTC